MFADYPEIEYAAKELSSIMPLTAGQIERALNVLVRVSRDGTSLDEIVLALKNINKNNTKPAEF